MKLRPANWKDGWLGAFDPVWDSWREIAPVAKFTGNKKRATWLYNAEFAHAWRGYMNPNPLICIRSPSTPWLLFGKNYLGNIAPIRPGKPVSWDYASLLVNRPVHSTP